LTQQSLAAVFHGAGHPLTLQYYPLPQVAHGEILVRVTCCTLCTSDVHTYLGKRSTPTPIIMGHEILGTIAAFGPGQHAIDYRGLPLEIGDRLTWSVATSCGNCFFCDHQIPQKCDDVFKYGHEKIHDEHPLSGGLSEYCHLSAGTAILRLADALSDVVACAANCATATVAAALRTGSGCRNNNLLIQGAGMLGLTACAMARASGAREIIVTDGDNRRLQQARIFGASQYVNVNNEPDSLRDIVAKTTHGRGVDLAWELSGARNAVESGLNLIRIGGQYVLGGSVMPSD
jgi:putative phosphonate catabolism associated alcohol dehydrogenase